MRSPWLWNEQGTRRSKAATRKPSVAARTVRGRKDGFKVYAFSPPRCSETGFMTIWVREVSLALVATSSLVSATSTGYCAFPFPSGPTLNPRMYWAGVIATTGGTHCSSSTNGIAYNADTAAGGPSNPFGTPSLANFQYSLVVLYTPVLTAGIVYAQLFFWGDALEHNYLANNIIFLKVTIPVAWAISKLTAFIQTPYSGAKCKGVIYDASGPSGGPGNLIGVSNELTSSVSNGNDLTFLSL